jgi:hypothetical protein
MEASTKASNANYLALFNSLAILLSNDHIGAITGQAMSVGVGG